jgi:hypothetical protein
MLRFMRAHRRTVTTLVAGLACGVLLLAGGCDPLAGPAAAQPGGDAAGGPAVGPLSRDAALKELATLPVGTWSSMTGYSRDKFKHWISQGNGCDTREVVLKRDGTAVQTKADCTVTGGNWVSAYDGVPETDPQSMDIDHMVPLANAWRTGAADWTDAQRSAFANDLTRPQLLAVSLSTNRSKGDQDPSEWKPPLQSYWCVYAQRWVAVKDYWKLRVTSAEQTALQQMLGTCA